MIPTKVRENRRVKALKLTKNLDRLYKEGKCRECAVVVTRMDFAKILGKFTKVKIQYESNKVPKTKQSAPNSNARLKSNENGMVHRNTYNQHPAKDKLSSDKIKGTESPSRVVSNVLKENNRLKKPNKQRVSNINNKIKYVNSNLKQYGIVFEDPLAYNNNNNCELNCKITLSDILPLIDDNILPSEDWCIDYFPKKDEPKDDQVYDRIAAELEDLMFNEKPITKLEDKPDETESKVDDFPSIMDILNDNSSECKQNDQTSSLDFKSNLESSDVEAMLLGKTDGNEPTSETLASTPMDVDNTNMGKLIEDVNQLTAIQDTISSVESPLLNEDSLPPSSLPDDTPQAIPEDSSPSSAILESSLPPTDMPENSLPTTSLPNITNNPHSPSILDEALQKGIEEHIPKQIEPDIESNIDSKTEQLPSNTIVDIPSTNIDSKDDTTEDSVNTESNELNDKMQAKENNTLTSKEGITHVVFKKTKEGVCLKSVTCPKTLKYGIEFDGKSIEFIGAPKIISSLEDLKVLLQIVNESELYSPYVMY